MNTLVIEFDPTVEETIIEQDGKPAAVVMTFDRYQQLTEERQPPNGRADDAVQQASDDFWHGPSLAALARRQGVRPIQKWEDLLGPEPPEGEESADEFTAQVRRWREEDTRWE